MENINCNKMSNTKQNNRDGNVVGEINPVFWNLFKERFTCSLLLRQSNVNEVTIWKLLKLMKWKIASVCYG